jgi:hypothetical protein
VLPIPETFTPIASPVSRRVARDGKIARLYFSSLVRMFSGQAEIDAGDTTGSTGSTFIQGNA